MNILIRKFLLLVFITIFLNSCAAINVTTSSAKEKGIKEAISDGMIDTGINKEFLNHDINMFINVKIEVVEGRVLLTGSVKKSKHRLDAIKLAWKVLGVREVINEIDITEKGGIKQYLIDVKIKTQIRYKVITDKEISSINYSRKMCINSSKLAKTQKLLEKNVYKIILGSKKFHQETTREKCV